VEKRKEIEEVKEGGIKKKKGTAVKGAKLAEEKKRLEKGNH